MISSSPEVSSTAQLAQVRTETLYWSQTSNEPEARSSFALLSSSFISFTMGNNVDLFYCKDKNVYGTVMLLACFGGRYSDVVCSHVTLVQSQEAAWSVDKMKININLY